MNGRKINSKKNTEKKNCIKCKKNKPINNYYLSRSTMSDGRTTLCKACIKEMIDYDNMETIYSLLQQMDVVFIHDYWQSAVASPMDTFGRYISMASTMPYFDGLTWKDSNFDKSVSSADQSLNENNVPIKNKNAEFIISEDIQEKWGYGYTPEEYTNFEKKWKKLIDNYGEKTSLHTEGLLTYIRFRVKEEMATAKGLLKDAKDWGALASTAAKDAKLNVAQLSKSDISGGVDLLSQLFEAVETEVGIIPLLPKLLEQPYDDADMIIWSIVNYTRRLEDKPPVQYRDIWNFYDEMLEEYYKQQNFNKKQIEDFKTKRNNVFRDLSEVYVEPLYESDDK